MAKNVLVLKHFETPKEAGIYFRLICLTGPNKGESYILLGNRIIIGRSDKVDIKLNDAKMSREHIEITKVGDTWVATDLGSQNGVIVNDKKITQKQLVEGDKLIVGQTVFKFVKVEVNGRQNVIKEEKNVENGKKKTMMPFLVLIVIIAVVFLVDDKENNVENKKSGQPSGGYQDVSNDYITALKKRQASEDKQTKEKLNVIYQRGLREFREGNYYRAIQEFNLALHVAPKDSQAEFYLRKTKEELDRSIENNIVSAQREEGSLKYQSAIKNYCAIIRLLYTVPEDPRFINAEKQIKNLENKLGMEQGETECLKKQRTNQ